MYSFIPEGVCSNKIEFDVVNGKIKNVTFLGGCSGNLKGISSLVEGMDAAEVHKRLKGGTCGYKSTSCTDQFARALEQLVLEK